MKPIHIVLLLVAWPLGGCAFDTGRTYAGSPGSVYDAASNPPQANGVVTYDPNAFVKPRDFGNTGGGMSAGKVP